MFSAAASNISRAVIGLLLCLSVLASPRTALGQNKPAQPPTQQQDKDEVIRISTEIVQTDVMVFDKAGKFVEGLRPEDFDLRVEGRPQKIEFFELVRAGTVDEDAQLRAARGGDNSARGPVKSSPAALPLDRGRTILFLVDDFHISPQNAPRIRTTLRRIIEEEIGQNDEAAVASTSGQIGFLQQLTDEKAVLLAAVERINGNSRLSSDGSRPPMSEAQAVAIENNSPGVLDWFVQLTLREMPGITADSARIQAQQRARSILAYSNDTTRRTLSALESLVRRTAALPGRKVLFFISEGFFIDRNSSDSQQRMRRITDAAARSGVVIYGMDARGLTTLGTDASVEYQPDPMNLQPGIERDELNYMQEPLYTLSADTGGRALVNTNALDRAVIKAVGETSLYYLLAWRPEGGEGKAEKFRQIQVSVRGRPDLKVSMRRGFFLTPPAAPEETKKEKEKESKNEKASAPPRTNPTDTALLAALTNPYPRTALPVSLALAYTNAQDDTMVLTASVEFDIESLSFAGEGAQRRATVDIVGVVYDDKGKALGTVREQLAILPAMGDATTRARAIKSYRYTITPGLHQVRFAATQSEGGRTGSVAEWIDVPDHRKKGFYLSSLFVGERAKTTVATNDEVVPFTADRRFSRSSWMRFVTFVYNPVGTPAAPPDVVLQVQVLRDNQPVLTTPLRKLEHEGVEDLKRIPYAAEVDLGTFTPGRYLLRVTAIDRTARTSASQQITFTIE